MTNFVAYHNDANLKASVLTEMASHRKADRLIQGHGYWSDGKGCAVGCLIKSRRHIEYEEKFGIPVFLARLEDGIFERLPTKEAQLWPERFLDAINTGSDLSMVFYKLMHWLLIDPKHGVLQYANTKRTKNSINKIADIYKQYIDGRISLEHFRAVAAAAADAAADAAAVAAADAAVAAADAAAADAAAVAAAVADAAAAYADAYAAAAAYAAADAAAAAAYADAYAAAAAYAAADAAAADADADADAAAKKAKRQEVTIIQANKLIELIKAA